MEPTETEREESKPEGKGRLLLLDLLHPKLWIVTVPALLLLLLYLSPALLLAMPAKGEAMTVVHFMAAVAVVPPLMMGYMLVYFLGGVLDREGGSRIRRFLPQALMIFGILPWLVLVLFFAAGKGDSGADGEGAFAEQRPPDSDGNRFHSLRRFTAKMR